MHMGEACAMLAIRISERPRFDVNASNHRNGKYRTVKRSLTNCSVIVRSCRKLSQLSQMLSTVNIGMHETLVRIKMRAMHVCTQDSGFRS